MKALGFRFICIAARDAGYQRTKYGVNATKSSPISAFTTG
jgi:hypothetical protein